MAKHGSRGRGSQVPVGKSVTVQVPLALMGVLGDTREAFHELCIRTGEQVLLAMMEADREALCGPKGRHREGRRAWRGGSAPSRVTLGGRQIELPRLRVRSPGGEVALESFQWASCTDALDAHTMAAVAAGVSTREYPRTLDPAPEAILLEKLRAEFTRSRPRRCNDNAPRSSRGQARSRARTRASCAATSGANTSPRVSPRRSTSSPAPCCPHT